jgi:hypothetical protein
METGKERGKQKKTKENKRNKERRKCFGSG